jgi:hypothetical protein
MVCLVPLINKDPLHHFSHLMKVGRTFLPDCIIGNSECFFQASGLERFLFQIPIYTYMCKYGFESLKGSY